MNKNKIMKLTFGQIEKLNDKEAWKIADEYTHPHCYECPNFPNCKPKVWQECETLLNQEYEDDWDFRR